MAAQISQKFKGPHFEGQGSRIHRNANIHSRRSRLEKIRVLSINRTSLQLNDLPTNHNKHRRRQANNPYPLISKLVTKPNAEIDTSRLRRTHFHKIQIPKRIR